MKSFLDPYSVLVSKVISHLPKSPFFSITLEVNAISFFEAKIASYFKQRPRIEHELFEGFPFLFSTKIITVHNGVLMPSHGRGFDMQKSILLAQAEFLERVSSWVPLDTAKELDFEIAKIQPALMCLKSALGFRFLKKESHEIYWGMAKQRGTKRHVTTSGIAGHFDATAATRNAWLELIERDSFLMYWLNTISPKHIDISHYLKEDSQLLLLTKTLSSQGYDYYILDSTSDIAVPTCLAVVVYTTPQGKKIGIGIKAGFDGEGTVTSALLEAFTILQSMSGLAPRGLPKDFKPFSDERVDKKVRLQLALTEEGFLHTSFLITSKEKISSNEFETCKGTILVKDMSVQSQLSYLKSLFRVRYKKNRDYDVFVYDFKNKLINMFGFHVIRVVCPALYPIYLSEHFADPDHPRLKEFVQNMHLEGKSKLNTWPHPFS